MKKIVHCADVHVSKANEQYSLSVLANIVDIAREENADVLLVAGDLFDSAADVAEMGNAVTAVIRRLPETCRAIYIPGNHEVLRASEPVSYPADVRLFVAQKKPFQTIQTDEVDFVCIPHQDDYSTYPEWELEAEPERKKRVVVAHGFVTGVSGLQFPGEEDESYLDPDLFVRLNADYVALGHVHISMQRRIEDVLMVYPGSARVWRRGELGPRHVAVVTLTRQEVHVAWRVVAAAGQERNVEITLGPDGPAEELEDLGKGWDSADTAVVSLKGLAESKQQVERVAADVRKRLGSVIREVRVERDGVVVVSGLSGQPVARRFLSLWRERLAAAGEGHASVVVRKARELGLEKIQNSLGSQK